VRGRGERSRIAAESDSAHEWEEGESQRQGSSHSAAQNFNDFALASLLSFLPISLLELEAEALY
jgi:hypothetical protein